LKKEPKTIYMYRSVPAFLLLFFVLSAAAQQQHSSVLDRFNIVLYIADDLGAGDIGPYGNKVVRTPHLDKFSKESMLFNRAFASSPTCSPSRSTIFTGLMPLRHGGHGNHNGVKEGTLSLVQYLKPLGYRVALAGKLHIGPESVFPFERIAETNVPEPGHEKKPGLNWDLNLDPVNQWLSRQKKNNPFMLIVADHSPHVIWPEKAAYDPSEVDIPAKHVDTKETRASRARYYTDITKMDNNVGKLLACLDRHGFAKNTIVLFVSDQGPQWPFAKWSLYDDGVQVPLMVRWPVSIAPGTKTGALVSLADLVPTLVESAGGKAPEGIDGQSFLPVLKGLKDTHRETVFATHTGDRLMNRAPARMVRTTQYKYILNLAPEILYHTHMDKAKDHDGGREYWDSWRERSFTDPHAAAVLWRYHNRPKEELYDMEADPQELHNLATDPKYAQLLEDFRVKMAEWRKGQADTFTGPEVIIEEEGEKKKGLKPVAPYVF
jgi:N-sulfoglucosamine sulfohydrolase